MSVSFKNTLLGCTCLTYVSAFGAAVGVAHADTIVLPQGGVFEQGVGTITQSAGSLHVVQDTSRAVVSWSDFSVGTAGAVHFANGSGATLNRVTGAHLSQIDGHLSATGSLYLLNPNGVVVGESGQIETGGSFVATTLIADTNAFMADGTLSLQGESRAAVVNLGKIAASAGDILLAAHDVRNEGELIADGEVSLLAARDVTFRDMGVERRLHVRAGVSGDVVNAGLIEGASARLEAVGGNIYALAGNSDGVARASIVARNGGRIQLTAAGLAEVAGHLDASDMDGNGGKVTVEGSRVLIRSDADISAQGSQQGGTIHVGGGWQGGDTSLRNAEMTHVAEGAHIDVSSSNGAGGEAVVWADQVTLFEGDIKAEGASETQGGRVEVSGKSHLALRGNVDTGGGTLLLDPTDLEIVDTVSGTAGQIVPSGGDFLALQTAAADTSQIAAGDIANLLENNNVLVTTQNANGNGNGDITVSAAIERTAGTGTKVLTLNAERDLIVNARIGSDAASRSLAVSMSAGRDTAVNATVETQGGVFSAVTGNNFTVGATGAIFTGGGALSISTDSDLDAGGFTNGTGMFRVVNGGSLVSGGADIRLESMGIDIAGPSASAIVIDAGTGGVHFNRRGAYADAGFYLSTRNTIGLQNGNYYLWYNDLAKVKADTLYANSERRSAYVTMYENYGSLNWATNVSGAAQVFGSRYFTVYGGLTNINNDIVLDHDGSRNSGINSISLGSSPINMNGNLTIKAPGFRFNGSGMYVRSANGNIHIKANEMFNQPTRGLRAPNGYIAFEGFAPGSFTAPGDIDWYGTPYYGWASSAEAPIVYVGSASDTTSLVVGALNATQTAGISQQLIFRAKDGMRFNGSVETATASISIQPDTDGGGGSAVLAAGQAIRAGGNLTLGGLTSSTGAATFGANGKIEVQAQVSTQGDLLLEADKDGDDDGDIVLTSSAALNTNGSDAVLSANRLINQAGAGVMNTGAGRYLIYTASPLSDTIGGLSGARRYNNTYAGTPPSGVAEAGNLFFYELAPTLALRAVDASRVYGQVNPALTFVADGAGLIVGDQLSDVAAGAVAKTAATTSSGAGNYDIDVDLANLTSKMGYTLQARSGQLSVTPASLTITADAASKTYGAADPNLTFNDSGWVNGETSALLTGGLSRAPGENVAGAPYAIGRGSLSAGANYAINYSGADFTINPASLTITANNAERRKGEDNPIFTAFFDGFVSGETPSVLSGALRFDTPASRDANTGAYRLSPVGLSDPNYQISFVDGILTVLPSAKQAGTAEQVLSQNGGAGRRALDEASQAPLMNVNNQQETGQDAAAARGAGSDAGGQSGTEQNQDVTGAGGGNSAKADQFVSLQYTVFGRTVTIKLPVALARLMQQAIASGSGLGGA